MFVGFRQRMGISGYSMVYHGSDVLLWRFQNESFFNKNSLTYTFITLIYEYITIIYYIFEYIYIVMYSSKHVFVKKKNIV